ACDEGNGVAPTGLGVFLDFSSAIQRYGLQEANSRGLSTDDTNVTKLGKEIIKNKYGNLFQMYEKISGENPYERPMKIYPAIHYTMGGIWVDYNLETNVPGLFAIGEANFSDHGANRLGASALMQGLADGYFVLPYTIGNFLSTQIRTDKIANDTPEFIQAEKDVKERLQGLIDINGNQSVESFHKKLGKIIWENGGMSRNETGLKKGIAEVRALRDEFYKDVYVPGTISEFNPELEKAARVADFMELGETLLFDALNRNESCGGHFREESVSDEGEAKRDDNNYTYVAAWEWNDGQDPKVHKEKLKFDNVELKTRSYK
ncbi:MAG: FAD-binding protein, partial [Saprospiraceae bacterium]|nr:FAD-binding protein [Saprospiraceae bacterium]